MAPDDPLDEIRELRELQADLPRRIREAGLRARAAGASWVDVQRAGGWPSAGAARRAVAEFTDEVREEQASRARARRENVTDGMPGVGVAEAARTLGVTRERVYTRIKNNELTVEVHTTPGGRPMRRIVAGLPGQPPAHSDSPK